MSVPGAANPLLLSSAAGGGGGSATERSVRFNSADSAYLSRTYSASSTNRKKQTFSFWIKRAALGSTQRVFDCYDGSSAASTVLIFQSDDTLHFYVGGSSTNDIRTTQVFRDASAWYHIVIAVDTTDGTASNRVKLYVNGSQVTALQTTNYPAQNTDSQFPSSNADNRIGTQWGSSSGSLNAYLSEFHFVDGQALDPTSFGEFDATTGVWNPIEYTGSYGTNGFHLDFADNSSAAALGYDAAGSNDWTVNNLSVTAGAGNDSLCDSPTNGDTANDTGLGNQVPGNYATLNPLDVIASTYTFSNGNLEESFSSATLDAKARGTVAVKSGKYYFEVTLTARGNTPSYLGFGVTVTNDALTAGGIYYFDSGVIYTDYNGNTTTTKATFAVNDVIGVAFDCDAGSVSFYKNNTLQHTVTGLSLANYCPGVFSNGGTGRTHTAAFNFGQRAFAYTAPSGFKALCTANLTPPTIADPSTVMGVGLYQGNGTSQSVTLPGAAFEPDLVWIKGRSIASYGGVYDTLRGVRNGIITALTNGEYGAAPAGKELTSFNSTGFTVGGDYNILVNTSPDTFAGWCWDAGSSTATNNDGSISSQVRANTSAGFSIVTVSPSGTADSFGHGLGVTPALIISKRRDGASAWYVRTSFLSNPGAHYLMLNATNTVANDFTAWANTPANSSVITVNASYLYGGLCDLVHYCFAAVNSYSAFGTYTGNGSADGPFIYTGMRPRWVMTKASSRLSSWYIHDTARGTYNVIGPVLAANTAASETTPTRLDILSNGFKIRDNDTEYNALSDTYIYAAFAENPFAYARAR